MLILLKQQLIRVNTKTNIWTIHILFSNISRDLLFVFIIFIYLSTVKMPEFSR